MSYGEIQAREIATVRPRTFSIELSDADIVRIFEKAGAVGLTPEKLLANFVGDLVDGTYTNGADERMYARSWFDRCGFSEMTESGFLKYLLDYGCYDSFAELLDDIDGYGGDYALLDENDPDYEDDKKYLDKAIESCKDDMYSIFCEHCDETGEDNNYDEELRKVKEYRDSLKKALYER